MQTRTNPSDAAGTEKESNETRDALPVASPLAEPFIVQRERAILTDLFQLVAERAAVEPRLDVEFKKKRDAEAEDFEIDYQEVVVRFAAEKEKLERDFQEAREKIVARYKTSRASADEEYKTARKRALSQFEKNHLASKAEYQEARWTVTAVFEGIKSAAENERVDGQQKVADAARRIQKMEEEARTFLQSCKQPVEQLGVISSASIPADKEKPFARLEECLTQADISLHKLKNLRLPRYIKIDRLVPLFLILWLVSLYPAYKLAEIPGLVGATVGMALVGLGLGIWLAAIAKGQVARCYQPMCRKLAEAKIWSRRCEDHANFQYHQQLGEGKKKLKKEVRQAGEKYKKSWYEFKERRGHILRDARDRHRRVRTDLKEWRIREWTESVARYRQQRRTIQVQYNADSKRVQEEHAGKKSELEKRHEQDWNAVITKWRDGLRAIQDEVTEINAESAQLFPEWDEAAWQGWAAPSEVPPVIRFGSFQANLSLIPNGEPKHPRLQNLGPNDYRLPAFLPFPDPCALLIRASDEGKAQAVQVLQAVMFRLLTAIPPGKVRFTIIDPVGLGRNFASFMHLADHDEALVTSRIWTEQAHIEQRLADLTGHMENVIQKYLRNQFETIEEYNVHAGEVAEPYRILVVANFPFNFTMEAAKRLISIVNSGPRCGVHTLITMDTKQSLPQGFNISDLEQPGVTLVWEDGRFMWQDDDFENFALEHDAPPPDALCTRVLQVVGQKALEAKRVEVPFDFVAPRPEQWWTGDTRQGINVALGRAGATKRQHLRLGQGTAQHVLIAGKTGSGKSTLLHALISNLALSYSPEEVELYLVDFKKGVEFKTYATHELPHARVVAIESEREFGLSVLQRLDTELKLRAERFRTAGVQDLKSYRQTNPGQVMPRILLIVDEFQEFFVEDDRLAQDASLLLDRLVRQGRAFGLHVLLGSQTLGGAYTLARSTIDQMAVRIALQCSEVDAHMILSEDNSAARLLSRPGEAIYNDANGLVEGNNPFQVVWLADERREEYLRRVQEMACARKLRPAPQIVFEGNAPADVSKNEFLSDLLRAPAWPASPKTCRCWLGDAIAIKDPTMAQFRAQSGNNLILIGQYEHASLGILSTALISLAAQQPFDAARPDACSRFYILDGSAEDDPNAGFFNRLTGAVPHPVKVGGYREMAGIISELAQEVDRRQKENDTAAPSLYLIVYGLQRFRDLRKADDDFSFSRAADDKPNPAKQFTTILTEGPSTGVHALVWSDSFNNVQRSLERQTLREFEMRVVFQMSAGDSSALIDSPLASKLGMHRAFFHSEEQGKLEKFRPYGLPTDAWLQWVKDRLAEKRLAT
jgi:S-DNA-T family DNA segregation ATPase FtsK/SpoIIIE